MGKLGDTLRERRVALGITLEQAEAGTRIRSRLLEALEDGAYERLPNPGYVRGYISSYARFLELDSVPLLNMYKAETGAARYSELNLPQTEEAVKPTGQQHAMPWRAALSVALAIALISLAIWAITRFVSGPEPTPPVPTPVTEPTSTPDAGNAATEETKPVVKATPDTQKEAPKQPFTLTVRVSDTGASWVRITVDGDQAYEGTLAAGQEKEYEVTSSAVVRIGKPESVTVLKDGKEVDVKNTGGISKVTIEATAAE